LSLASLAVSLNKIVAFSIPNSLTAPTPVQASSDPASTRTTSATPSYDVAANATGVSMSSLIQGNGMTPHGTPEHLTKISENSVPQAVTAPSSGADIHRTSQA
jgi:hypothetical protein